MQLGKGSNRIIICFSSVLVAKHCVSSSNWPKTQQTETKDRAVHGARYAEIRGSYLRTIFQSEFWLYWIPSVVQGNFESVRRRRGKCVRLSRFKTTVLITLRIREGVIHVVHQHGPRNMSGGTSKVQNRLCRNSFLTILPWYFLQTILNCCKTYNLNVNILVSEQCLAEYVQSPPSLFPFDSFATATWN